MTAQVRESSTEKERDAKFPAPPVLSAQRRAPADTQIAETQRRRPLTWARQHLPPVGRHRGRLRGAPGLPGSATHPSLPKTGSS